jgi:uncharacterized protein YfaT (DUF1175 family)
MPRGLFCVRPGTSGVEDWRVGAGFERNSARKILRRHCAKLVRVSGVADVLRQLKAQLRLRAAMSGVDHGPAPV